MNKMIIGTGLAALGGGLGNWFGSNGHYTNGNGLDTSMIAGNGLNGPTTYEVSQKQCQDAIELTKGIYDSRILDLKEKFDLYKTLDDKISSVERTQAIVNAQMPLMFQLAQCTSERYSDNNLVTAQKEQALVNFTFQRELDKKLDGTMGLPFGDLITGVPTMPALQYCVTGCNCPGCGNTTV